MCIVYDTILFISPCCLFNLRIEVVMPPFTTLFSYSSLQLLCNQSPSFRPIFSYKFNNFFILFFGPRSWKKPRVTSDVWLNFCHECVSLFPIHLPLTSSGLTTFCHLCWHWTSARSGKWEAMKSHLSPCTSTKRFNFSSSSFDKMSKVCTLH